MNNFFKKLPYKYLFYLGLPVVITFIALAYWQFTSYLDVEQQQNLYTDSDTPTKTLVSEISLRKNFELITIQQELTHVKSWFVRSRVNNGLSGYYLVSAYKDADSNHILINKGWVPLSSELNKIDHKSYDTYVGILVDYDIKPGIGQDDIPNSDFLFRVDKNFISSQIGAELPTFFLQLTENCGENIICINNEEQSEPPHLGYAFQWMFFALCFTFVILRKNKLI